MTGPDPSVLVVGEALIDLIPSPDGSLAPSPGGAPANVAAGISRLGTRAAFAGTLSTDAFGSLLKRRLTDAGVDLALCEESDRPTALAVASPQPHGTRYDFHHHDTATFRLTPHTGGLDGFSAVYVGGLAAVVHPAAGAVLATALAAARETVLAVDPNVREDRSLDRADALRRLRELCDLAHVVKVSDEDASLLWPGEAPGAACRRLSAGGRLVVLTLGAQGSMGFLPDAAPIRVPAVPVEVVDTIGAGDAFMAALLAGLVRLDSRPADLAPPAVVNLLHRAATAAATVCGRAGAALPAPTSLTPRQDR